MFAASKTASVSGGYQISRSLRFNSADSAYLNRTPASAGNRTTWTWSGWIKRSVIGTGQSFFVGNSSFTDANYTEISFLSDNNLYVYGATTNWRQTTQVFRDVSAWYHIVIVWDTTQATAANRIKLYVNGAEVTSFVVSNNPAQNATSGINAASVHYISSYNSSAQFYNGYMTEVNFIDGQALTPSSFGATSAITGVWEPKLYTGTYGTNGFYLNFLDNSNTTAATLGKDYSGNGNNWTPNNFSVTAGAGNDSLVDSPTSYGGDTGVGGEVRGNYATWNPVASSSYATLSNGNLNALGNTAADNGCLLSTIGVTSGKWYWEETIGTVVTNYPRVGAMLAPATNGIYPGRTTGAGYLANGVIEKAGSTVTTVASFTTNDVIGMALDLDNLTLAFYKNNTLQYTVTALTAGTYFLGVGEYNGSTSSVNFGQRPFAYTAPSGFKALCTQNLPTPTIGATPTTQASKYFNPVLYTGNGTGQSITGVGFQPDWVWVKSRSAATDHAWYDAVRGVQKQIESNTTTAETTETTGLTAFGSDGFTTGALAQMNTSAATYVAWNWKANGAGSSNTSGSITSTVSASTTSGFSVATYTGTGVAGTIGHGLGVAPSMIIVKSRSATGAWPVYFSTLGNGSNLVLNTTAATATSSTIWNATSPTSSVFSVGINTDSNTVTVTYVAYCFAEVAGYSKFGSFTGNGSADGPFVYTGFRPAYVMVKKTNSTSDWLITDAARDTYNVVNKELDAQGTFTEGSGFSFFDYLSNGFKSRGTNPAWNTNGDTYIFMAFASNPFKYSLAR